MYDPTVGRFITEDPIGFDGGDTNLARYVRNSPTNATDPTGEWPQLGIPGFETQMGDAEIHPPAPPPTARDIFMDRLRKSRNNTSVFPFWPNQCERWTFEFERQLGKTAKEGGNSCVKEKGVTHFTFPKGRNLGMTSGHAAYRVIFRDGTVVYIDNGAFGGIFSQCDIPPDAVEDFPP